MAEFITMTPGEQEEYAKWLSDLPPHIQETAKKYPPTRLYRNKETGQRVTIISYENDGTCTVFVAAKFNACAFERRVFGVPMTDLEECDLPGPDEKVGAVLTDPQEIDKFIDASRPFVLAERERMEKEKEKQ